MTNGAGIAVLGIWAGAAAMVFALGGGPGVIPIVLFAALATGAVANSG